MRCTRGPPTVILLPQIVIPLLFGSGIPSPVFTRDIAPILFRHCATCHHEGEAAPFPLIRYEDVKTRAKLIAEVTQSRLMPPWKPLPGYGHFDGERRLSVAEIQAIRKWADAGAPEGNPAL